MQGASRKGVPALAAEEGNHSIAPSSRRLRTLDSQSGNGGSNPPGVTEEEQHMKPYSVAYDTTKKLKKELWLGVPYAKKNRSRKKAIRREARLEVMREATGSALV